MNEIFIRAIMVEPLKNPKEVYLLNHSIIFDAIVSISNCYICDTNLKMLENDIGILRNEEGSLLNLKGNRYVEDEIIAGTFLVVGIDENGNIISLTDEQCEKYCNKFWDIEFYSDKEVSKSYWDRFENMINSFE